MAFSPGLSLYLFVAARAEPLAARALKWKNSLLDQDVVDQRLGQATQARPAGPLVWLQAPTPQRAAPLVRFARRLAAERPDVNVLITLPESEILRVSDEASLIAQIHPLDTRPAIRRFLDHWRPDLVLFTEGITGPGATFECGARDIPSLLIDAQISLRAQSWLRWAPLASRAVFKGFRRILAGTTAQADAFERLGADPERVEVTGTLEEGSVAPGCNEGELDAMAGVLAGRPVWLAASVPEEEFETVIAAHQRASRMTHRLLLIVAPRDPSLASELMQLAKDGGMGSGLRSRDDDITDSVSVFVADEPEELGMWYRLAPVTYMAGTLSPTTSVPDPYVPAALGSAMIHGPDTGSLREAYARFRTAGASRQIGSAEALASAITRLQAPDLTAETAHHAWQVASRGADVSDRVIEMIGSYLDPEAA